MAKTSFNSGDPLSPAYLHALAGTSATTGHSHDGQDVDGSVPKITLDAAAHVTGDLPLANQVPEYDYIGGMHLQRNPADSVIVNAGTCASANASGAIRMTLTSALTKAINLDWAVGTGQGGFPSSLTLTDDTWYYVFVISDGTTTDAGYDTDSNADNLLADSGYSYYRRLGAVWYIDSTTEIRPFYNRGNMFWWLTTVEAASATSVSNVGVTTIPLEGLPPLLHMPMLRVVATNTNDWQLGYYTDMNSSSTSIYGVAGEHLAENINATVMYYGGINQIYMREITSALATTATCYAYGWQDLSR